MVIKEKKTMMCNDGVEQRCNGHREGRSEKRIESKRRRKEKAVTQENECRTVTQQ
jgi:hypothetical protein